VIGLEGMASSSVRGTSGWILGKGSSVVVNSGYAVILSSSGNH